jgi:5-methylcytosine-specific restriction protein A
MPIINKTYATTKKKTKRKNYSSKLHNDNHIHVYNSSIWRNLRITKLKNDPLCEMCKSKGKLTLAIDVHHIIPISSTNDIQQKKALGFDYNNLMSLCKDCHKEIHS